MLPRAARHARACFRALHIGVEKSSGYHLACLRDQLEAPIGNCPCGIYGADRTEWDWPESGKLCNDVFERYAKLMPQPLSMEEVLALRDPEETTKLLKRELPVRLANRIAHMNNIDVIEECEILLCARARLLRSLQEVVRAAEQQCPDAFAQAVRNVKKRHKHQVKRMTMGMLQYKDIKITAGENEVQVLDYIDNFIDRFVLSRIGIEMLNSQHLGLISQNKGIMDPRCDPCEVAKLAASHARRLASQQFESVPEVEITFFGNEKERTIPLVPSYLLYILMELLKNSFRAVAEQHVGNGKKLHPIVIRIASDESQVVLDIFDRGGGIPFEHQPHMWSYMYSTKRRTPRYSSIDEADASATPLAGYGVGLPLLRKYAEYLGGSVNLISMPKFGTHAFVFLQRCTSRREGMPTYVNWLRRRDLQEKLVELEARKRASADIEDYVEALRLKGLAAEVREELDKLDQWAHAI
eukprot:TRINITY_DN79888_c0_g1_i1.p1 TRINITY_DN79888_c0_g1~~TRINITY_DN79888_c0_g1_i1.p1  ORF type:complete len:468 (-),score=97.01 TRINITY_DN79888_c0_g1_i1:101-1504(-)